MVFSELLEIIQHERNLSDDELAEEIGITTPSLRNILNRKVVKPDGTTSRKILHYCRKYNIDTEELDWNEIIYEHFQNSPKYKEYQWEDDIDGDGFIKMKHKKCGKSTLVPISAFDGNSMLCIHCWIDNYISKNEYDCNEYDAENYYKFLHVPCGYKYRVSYEQIKQKKYRCPKCFSHSKNANMPAVLGKNDYNFIRYHDLPESWMNLELLNKYVYFATEQHLLAWNDFNSISKHFPDLATGMFKNPIDKESVVEYRTYFSPFAFEGYADYLKKFGINLTDISDKEKKEKRYLLFVSLKTKDDKIDNSLSLINTQAIEGEEDNLVDSVGVVISSVDGDDESLMQLTRENEKYFSELLRESSNEEIINDSILAVKSQYAMYSFFKGCINSGDDANHALYALIFSKNIDSKLEALSAELSKLIEKQKELQIIKHTSIADLNVSIRVFNSLARAGIHTVDDLFCRVKSVKDLRSIRNLTWHYVLELLDGLDEKGYRLPDCNREKYKSIDEYIKDNYRCVDCGSALGGASECIRQRLCPACVTRHKRIEIPRRIDIEVKKTEYSTYTGNEKGFTLYINILPNNIQEPIKLKLQECSIISNGRQYASNYNYVGYAFSEGYLIPDTVKTFAKVWITDSWLSKELEEGNDYLTISIKDETNNKIYYFKLQFVLGENWSLYDYYELD